MKTRTSIVLAVVALGLGLFIYLYERNLPSTDELRERRDRILPDFDRDRVDRLVLGEGDERIELERVAEDSADASPTGAVGQWRLLHPMSVDADSEAVDSLLSAIDWLERRSSVEAEGAAKASKFGLNEPRAQLELRLRGRNVKLSVGGKAPGKALYLARSGEPNKAYVVDEEFLEQITKEPGDLRDKRLAKIRVPDTLAIRVIGRFHANRAEDDRWFLETPIAIRANQTEVEAIVRDLERLRATRYVADNVTEDGLGQYGLGNPVREVSLRLRGQDEAVTFRFGGSCEGHSDEIYATAFGSGTVACVAQSILEETAVDVDGLRDMRPTTLEEDDLTGLLIVSGNQRVALRRSDDNWFFGETEDANDDESSRREADSESVESLINALKDTQADDVTTELQSLGLDGDSHADEVVIRLRYNRDGDDDQNEERDDSERREEVLRFAIEDTGVFLRRGDEAVALVLPQSFAEHLNTDPLRYRHRRLLHDESTDAVELEVSHAGHRQILRKRGNRWQMIEPFEFEADDVTVRDIVRATAELRAERFVAERPTAQHALARPQIRLVVRYESSDENSSPDAGARERVERTVLIGGEVEGGKYARLDGEEEVVFILPDVFVDRLIQPLIDRDLFAVDENRVSTIVIERAGAERVELHREGQSWRMGDADPPEGAVDRLLSRLAVARASEVTGYGAAAAVTGLATPRARLILGLTSEEAGSNREEYVMIIGAEYGDENSRLVYTRRNDVNATFGVPTRVVVPILEWGVASEAEADEGVVSDD